LASKIHLVAVNGGDEFVFRIHCQLRVVTDHIAVARVQPSRLRPAGIVAAVAEFGSLTPTRPEF
jgi:hypothetical protein